MPAILVASKMKSGLPKPVHGNRSTHSSQGSDPPKACAAQPHPLKSPIYRQQSQSSATLQKKYQTAKETSEDPQVGMLMLNLYVALWLH